MFLISFKLVIQKFRYDGMIRQITLHYLLSASMLEGIFLPLWMNGSIALMKEKGKPITLTKAIQKVKFLNFI